MKVDLSKCVGCGTCGIACKIGNNTPKRQTGQTHNRADYITETTGYFPYTKWTALPVQCNHCENPLCVAACPVSPVADTNCVGGQRKAMYKLTAANGGFVLHDDERCYGCRRCQRACPYSALDVNSANAQFSVISGYDRLQEPFQYLQDTTEYIASCTGSEDEVRSQVSMSDLAPGYANRWEFAAGAAGAGLPPTPINDVRRKNIVDKCYLCYHRLNDSSLGSTENAGERRPYCVIACPAAARELVTTIPSGGKVLAHKKYTYLRKIVLVNPSTIGTASIPNTYYVGNFGNR